MKTDKKTQKALNREIERLRHKLAEESSRHEENVKEMRNEIAEMKALLIRVLQNGSVPSPPLLLPSVRSMQPLSPKQKLSPTETRSSSKRSSGSRPHRQTHRRQYESRSDGNNGDDYQGLPLTGEADVSNELPSVRVLQAMRAQSPLKLQTDDQGNS